MEHSGFVHLHTHTEYSLLDGACKIDALMKKAKEEKMPALAITDHGNIFGAVEFYLSAMKHGIKPIIGCEMYMAPESRLEKKINAETGETAYHITLLVKDETGYKNLIKLINSGYTEGFYYKPRIDRELLFSLSEGLVCLSGCLKGEASQLILKGRADEARKVIGQFKDAFRKDFYIEIQDNGIKEQKDALRSLLDISREAGVPLVATNDIHYLRREDSYAHEVLLCIQTTTSISDPSRLKFSTPEFYFKGVNEMKALFSEYPESISNTVVVAESCNLALDLSKTHLPPYKIPEGYSDADEYLKDLCAQGLKKRYSEITPEIQARADEELEIIKKTKFSGYFLIVWDFVKHAKESGILVGPGRGSAVGSLVVYSLGITNLDPLANGLLFERFLNPERVSPPDIDIDFADDRRGEVVDYIIQRFGSDRVSQIITFGTLKPRLVIRDVARALDISLAEADKIAKLVPFDAESLEDALEKAPEFKKEIGTDERYKQLIKVSSSLQGLVRHASTHAAGVVITPEKLENYVPIYKDSKGELATQFDMNWLAKLGLIKIDILGLRNLTIIKDALALIRERKGIDINIDKLPMDDPPTYKLLQEARTSGVFQIESSGFRDLLKRVRIENFNDLVAILSLHRPGPLGSGMVDDYIDRKHGRKPVEYLHPKLESTLKETYGIIVYQEQVMKSANILANFSLGKADLLRRAMGKKIPEEMEQQREAFLKGAKANGIADARANKIFDLIDKFAGYGFNKSHSAAYSMISYQTAFLKANYPVEYITSLLTNEMGNTDKLVEYINECRKMGIELLNPDIQKSMFRFSIEKDSVRFGLGAVKNVGDKAVESIMSARNSGGDFKSIEDLCARVDTRLVNKKVIESLVKCGAFDPLGKTRAGFTVEIDPAMQTGARIRNDRERGQDSLFGTDSDGLTSEPANQRTSEPVVEEWSHSRLLAEEKEVLGFYISGHPLGDYEEQIKRYANVSSATLKERSGGNSSSRKNFEARMGGIITAVKKTNDRKGNRMAFVTIEDLEGSVEAVVFSDVFEKYNMFIRKDLPVLVKGDADTRYDMPKILAKEFIPLDEAQEKFTKTVRINLNAAGMADERMEDLKKFILEHKGNCPLSINIRTKSEEYMIPLGADYYVKPSVTLVQGIEELFGSKVVSLE